MKRTSLLIATFMLGVAVTFGQPPVGINYQAALYDSNDEPMTDEDVTVTFTVLEGSESGTAVYEEEHAATTSGTGIVNLVIGEGSSLAGNFTSVNWADHSYYVNVDVDGNDMGTFPFQNVPYSKVATDMNLDDLRDVTGSSPSTGQVIKWTGSQWEAAEDSSHTPVWNTNGDNISYDSGKVFINRSAAVTSYEYFGLTTPTTGAGYGGMYINTDSVTGRPFYGYATNGIDRAWTYWDGSDSTYKVYNAGVGLAVDQNGNVGLGTVDPEHKLHVEGDMFVNSNFGAIRFGLPEGDDAWQFATTGGGNTLLLREVNENNDITSRLSIEQEGFFEVTHGNDGGNIQGLKISNQGGNNNDWNFYVSNSLDDLFLYANGTTVGSFDATTGDYSTSSDRNLKKDIREMDSVLADINKLPVKKYRFKTQPDDGDFSIGLIAQDVQPLFPELVTQTGSDAGDETLGLNYSGFGVLAIKAIQEQQEIIEEQEATINDLIKRVEKLEEQINQ